MDESTLLVSKIPNMNVIVLKQIGGQKFFYSTSNSIIIDVPTLAMILKYLVVNDFMSVKVLEGIISEVKE